jgi:hypothetical protein
MPTKTLTDAFVRNVKKPPKPDQIAYFDTLERGLALVLTVSYGGSKTFSTVTYERGKARSINLGRYPEMTVKAARQKAKEHFAEGSLSLRRRS